MSRSLALCILGFAYREKGDSALAIELIGRAIDEQTAFAYREHRDAAGPQRSPPAAGHLGRRAATRACRRGRRADGHPPVQAAARRALGRIAAAAEDLVRAEAHLGEALARFHAVGARFEAGLTHLALAELAHRRGDRGSAEARLDAAILLFTLLDAPVYLERARLLRSGARVGSGRRAE